MGNDDDTLKGQDLTRRTMLAGIGASVSIPASNVATAADTNEQTQRDRHLELKNVIISESLFERTNTDILNIAHTQESKFIFFESTPPSSPKANPSPKRFSLQSENSTISPKEETTPFVVDGKTYINTISRVNPTKDNIPGKNTLPSKTQVRDGLLFEVPQ